MSIIRLDPSFDALVPRDARIEKVAGGFTFTEGPLWRPSGVLWFSDVVGNVVRQWSPDGTVMELLQARRLRRQQSAGRRLHRAQRHDGRARTATCCSASTAIAASCGSTNDLRVTTLVDKFEGKRLNAPNDLVFRSDGTLFFTDPPYGLPLQDDDPDEGLPFNGVYKVSDGKLEVIIKDLTRPNGIAFSPDEKTLYVSNSDEKRRIWMRYDIAADRNRQQRPRLLRCDGSRRRRRARWDEDRRSRQHVGDRTERGLRASRPMERTSARSSRPRIPPIADGATTAGRCTSRRKPDCIAIKTSVDGTETCVLEFRSRFWLQAVGDLHDSSPRRARHRSGERAGDACGTFKTVFRPAAMKFRGYIDVRMLKLQRGSSRHRARRHQLSIRHHVTRAKSCGRSGWPPTFIRKSGAAWRRCCRRRITPSTFRSRCI